MVRFSDINGIDTLWQRISSNFSDSNMVICIEGHHEEEIYTVLDLIEVQQQNRIVKLLQCKSPLKSDPNLKKFSRTGNLPPALAKEQKIADETGVFYVEWDDNIQKHFHALLLCWNPTIYPIRTLVHSQFEPPLIPESKFFDPNFCVESMPQILLTIPPHQEEFEVRVFLTRHVREFQSRTAASFKLFNYDGQRIIYPHDSLRSFDYATREMSSDVFIFSASTEYESYVLVILCEETNAHLGFSLEILSFVTLDIKELPPKPIQQTYDLLGKWPIE